MSVYLEKFTLPKVPRLALEALELVTAEKEWLDYAYPGTRHRYRDMPHAVKNVARVAVNRGMEAFVIRDRRRGIAKGLATVIFDQTVIHPTAGPISGNNLDYWLGSDTYADEDQQRHQDVANELIEMSSRQSLKTRGEYPIGANSVEMDRRFATHNFFAVVGADHLSDPIGLTDQMTLQGGSEPVTLTTPSGEDPYGVTNNGQPSLLFTGSRTVSS